MRAIEFRFTMDPCSRDVFVDEKRIGSIQWHKERQPCFVATAPAAGTVVLPLALMKKLVHQIEIEVGHARHRDAKA